MKRRLSSIITPFYKILPFVVGAYFLFVFIKEFDRLGIETILFLLLWCGIWYLCTYRWKNVYLEDRTLYVSNFFRSITIPVREIEQVRASSWWGMQPRTIKLTLKKPTAFGKVIVFVPRLAGYRGSEIVKELQHLKGGFKGWED